MEEQDFEKKIVNALDFYYSTNVLKMKKRIEWVNLKINTTRLETYAEHVYGCQMLLWALYSEFDLKIDVNKVLAMLSLHSLEKIIIPDYSQFEKISREQKLSLKKQAVEYMCGNLKRKDEYESIIDEFNERKTKEAKTAYLIDKLEKCLQAKRYEDLNNNQIPCFENNPMYDQNKIEEIKDNGATTLSEIMCEYSADLFDNDEEFKRVLEYSKDFDSNII